MSEMFDRPRLDAVLTRVGMPEERRRAVLDEIDFPIELEQLAGLLLPLGITHDVLTDRMGGSP